MTLFRTTFAVTFIGCCLLYSPALLAIVGVAAIVKIIF